MCMHDIDLFAFDELDQTMKGRTIAQIAGADLEQRHAEPAQFALYAAVFEFSMTAHVELEARTVERAREGDGQAFGTTDAEGIEQPQQPYGSGGHASATVQRCCRRSGSVTYVTPVQWFGDELAALPGHEAP